jgi:hypothetical protein
MPGKDEPRLFIELRGVGPSDFRTDHDGQHADEAAALAADIHDLVREKYAKSDLSGVIPVVNSDVHERLVEQC